MSTQVSEDFKKHGGSYLLSNNAYEDYVQGKDVIGRPDGQFMAPSNQMDELIQNNPNNPREWERQLGLNDGSLGNNDIHRVDVYHPNEYSPRMPTSDLSGANEKFLEGKGKTPGGQDECVINPFPNPEKYPESGRITTIPIEHAESNSFTSYIEPQKYHYDKVSAGGGSHAPPITATDNTERYPIKNDGNNGKVTTNNADGFYNAKVSPTNNSSDVAQGINKHNTGFNM